MRGNDAGPPQPPDQPLESGDQNDRDSNYNRGPLRSRFPGELALRDLYEGAPPSLTCLIAARFAVLQVAERYATGWVSDDWLEVELSSAEAYLAPVRESAVADSLRLRHLVDRMRANQPNRVAAALLAAGDTAVLQSHIFGAVACFRAAHELATRIGRNAIALSAASRLAELAMLLQRPRSERRWQRECADLLVACR
ncbi:MAG TPA: hypothetical protein VK864_07070 [Longimicrobiales bacterium]|nr:hypothetical protein [Longimicrobiales bacterium]